MSETRYPGVGLEDEAAEDLAPSLDDQVDGGTRQAHVVGAPHRPRVDNVPVVVEERHSTFRQPRLITTITEVEQVDELAPRPLDHFLGRCP